MTARVSFFLCVILQLRGFFDTVRQLAGSRARFFLSFFLSLSLSPCRNHSSNFLPSVFLSPSLFGCCLVNRMRLHARKQAKGNILSTTDGDTATACIKNRMTNIYHQGFAHMKIPCSNTPPPCHALSHAFLQLQSQDRLASFLSGAPCLGPLHPLALFLGLLLLSYHQVGIAAAWVGWGDYL
mmetsp:Transcript_16733/g.33975  ORF Transcript_16733/g.33975 Transcript_16733/m.33975 type:complete len:182 (-) Transcript_16733:252-797(-)